ncbi:RNA polymerase sigma-70 factor [Sabulilitoribacter arenilitoris]|uniref:RNA polymerase sigma-70 factor n=1 Tax=Wocania arenilitoris TaxID=2044858 RepID=A0AAE3JKD6_9FLAO|nr:RNA polymerase sigma-70 factor [Wocania arenilitoris]MCF7567983.1 RNA polymerase sigma-70 factor [Wocania arenilitoris]
MRRIKNSDHHAFKLLYDRLWESLYVRAFSILGDKNIAKDIVQEVWISFWERRAEISNDNIEGYLLRAVRFKVYNEFRNSKYKNKLIGEFLQSYKPNLKTNNVEQTIQLKDTEKAILEAVNSLPNKCKRVFELSRFEGMKNEEIAQKLNISKRTVETHISNALKVLKNNVALSLAVFLELF